VKDRIIDPFCVHGTVQQKSTWARSTRKHLPASWTQMGISKPGPSSKALQPFAASAWESGCTGNSLVNGSDVEGLRGGRRGAPGSPHLVFISGVSWRRWTTWRKFGVLYIWRRVSSTRVTPPLLTSIVIADWTCRPHLCIHQDWAHWTGSADTSNFRHFSQWLWT
jgi:hypothetical protein